MAAKRKKKAISRVMTARGYRYQGPDGRFTSKSAWDQQQKKKTKPKPKKQEPKQEERFDELTGYYIMGQSIRKAFHDALMRGARVGLKYGNEITPYNYTNALEFEAIHDEVNDYYVTEAARLGFDSPQLYVGYVENLRRDVVFDFDDVLFANQEIMEEEEPELVQADKKLKKELKKIMSDYGLQKETGSDKLGKSPKRAKGKKPANKPKGNKKRSAKNSKKR